jgi:DNA-binding XRE family transcriptional regulator
MQGLLLSEYKKRYELTQDEIGKLFDVSGRTIRNWLDEKGE